MVIDVLLPAFAAIRSALEGGPPSPDNERVKAMAIVPTGTLVAFPSYSQACVSAKAAL